jgi:hypothetical protein
MRLTITAIVCAYNEARVLPACLYSLCEKSWEAIAPTLRANVDVALTLYRNGSWAA